LHPFGDHAVDPDSEKIDSRWGHDVALLRAGRLASRESTQRNSVIVVRAGGCALVEEVGSVNGIRAGELVIHACSEEILGGVILRREGIRPGVTLNRPVG
jgi:hypothetical protein